jgi:hypothetical protein
LSTAFATRRDGNSVPVPEQSGAVDGLDLPVGTFVFIGHAQFINQTGVQAFLECFIPFVDSDRALLEGNGIASLNFTGTLRLDAPETVPLNCSAAGGGVLLVTLKLEAIQVDRLSFTGPSCGNDRRDPGEACDGADASLCPGACQPDCTCAAATLVRLTLSPQFATRAVGEFVTFAATGTFSDGSTRNLTQQVTYTSSDPVVAVAPNDPGNRSRVTAVGPGVAVISAVDPVTGVSTTDSGGDATVTVVGALERISLSPQSATRTVGGSINYTATGFFGGGVTRNLTQQLIYASSDPNVAVALNLDGNRSRVEALAPGTVTVSATDPITGISTTTSGDDATLNVVSP